VKIELMTDQEFDLVCDLACDLACDSVCVWAFLLLWKVFETHCSVGVWTSTINVVVRVFSA
jgi:hypothetical protein